MAEIRWDYEQISSFVDQLEACIDVLGFSAPERM